MALDPVRPDGSLDGEARARQKQASRDRDELLLASGRMSQRDLAKKNNWFKGIDFSKLRIASVGGVPYEDLE